MHGGQSTHLRYTLGMVVDRLQQMGRPSITSPAQMGRPSMYVEQESRSPTPGRLVLDYRLAIVVSLSRVESRERESESANWLPASSR
jgi:hypothetical protein